MRSPAIPVLAALDDLSRAAAERRCTVWRLDAPESDLEVAAVRLPPGAPVEFPDDSEALLVVLDGQGYVRSPSGREELAAHTAAWLPRGTEARAHAGDTGMYCLTIRPPRSGRPAPPPGAAPAPAGGEPACLLQQVCAECGRMATESDARYCNRCGTPLPA
ncbi:cupin domain-containing protein [Streptomyces sp. NPDC005551]|uniref:cupin domain-containing protein n=1 Tax=unclassified Streptomyces TaxID=2593676 RepID=UPI0033DA4516